MYTAIEKYANDSASCSGVHPLVADAGKNLGLVDDSAWKQALHNGWTPEQLAESFAFFSIVVYMAYFTNFAATESDVPSGLPTEA